MRTVLLVAFLSVSLTAQEASAPTVSELDVRRIENYELKAENIALKITQLQADFQKLQVEASTFFKTLEREGYKLERRDNSWVYTPLVPK